MEHYKIENLTFSYPVTSEKKSLDSVNLSIEKGQYITLCGKSGSGKTTLLRHLKTVLTPHGSRTGRIYYCGKELDSFSRREQSSEIGYVMQNPDSQIVTDKVWHELAFGLESLGCDQRTMRLRVAEMASYFGIQSWFDKDVTELSGGQKQLLNLASIMAMQPSVLILDEPTSQLDPIAAADFLNTVRKINLELGTTVILSEHRLEEVFPCSDRIMVMDNGRIITDAPPRETGRILNGEKSDMMAALPSPVQIYFSTESSFECPLTVREGRTWLTAETEKRNITARGTGSGKEYCEPEKPVLEIRELWFRYEKELPDILKGVSLKVSPSSIHAVVGGNGTGKSTMLKAMCGIVRPYRGKILIDGKNINVFRKNELFDGCLAMLPQDPQSIFVKKSVREDLEEMIDGDSEKKNSIIRNTSELCGVTDLLDAHPYDLSGGEQQRAALAKVLLVNPRILLLDEPTKGIDSFFKIRFAGILRQLNDKGVTVVMVSHDVEFCARYADAVSMFFDGAVITTNTPGRFFAQNSFYTTAANRMSRHVFDGAVTNEDVAELVNKDGRHTDEQ